jgi:adenosylmethionine-8-amino-7-oxononanoate aminotransferase
VFSTGFTYSGHPVACAAALKNIEIMERENILGNVRDVGPYLEQQLKTLLDLPIVGDVRGSHFMMCIESVADKNTKALLPMEANVGKRIAEQCQKRGLIVRPIAHLNVLSPPLIWSRETVDLVLGILRQSILATVESLIEDGHYQA